MIPLPAEVRALRPPGRVIAIVLAAIVLADLAALGVELSQQSRPAGATVLASGPYAGRTLYAAPTSAAGAARHEQSATARARLRWLARQPQAVWLTGGSPRSSARTVATVERRARTSGAVPSFVVYDIPHRDCSGGYSAGGAASREAYVRYIDAIGAQLGRTRTIVVLEPDSLAGIDCLDGAQQYGRLQLLTWAVEHLAKRRGTEIYLDGGNSGWQTPSTMAKRLIAAGIADARGFAVNVSNYDPTASEIRYGRQISAQVGWKHFVVDTSRNGARARPDGWCNPSGARVGAPPGTPPSDPAVDALLWIKHPGESDGTCGESPDPAGTFDPRLALRLLAHTRH